MGTNFQRDSVHVDEGDPLTSGRPSSAGRTITVVLMITEWLSTWSAHTILETLPVSSRPDAVIVVDGPCSYITVLDVAACQCRCWTFTDGFARLIVALELSKERGSSRWRH